MVLSLHQQNGISFEFAFKFKSKLIFDKTSVFKNYFNQVEVFEKKVKKVLEIKKKGLLLHSQSGTTPEAE